MIVFCEDCGGKNSLSSSEIINNKIIFKCTCCGYLNKYKSGPTNRANASAKTVSLDQLVSSKDIIGGMIYHRDNGILVNHMSKILTTADLEFLGFHLLKNIDICQKLNIEIERMILYISGHHTAVRQIDTNCIAVIVGKSQKALLRASDMLNNLVDESFQFGG